jgi:hypothetical protein
MKRRYLNLFSLFVMAALVLSATGMAAAEGAQQAYSEGASEAIGALADLYDQINNPGLLSDAIISQNYEAVFDSLYAHAADDFKVPVGQSWTINTVEVRGVYGGGGSQSVASVNVYFYSNSGSNLPGAQLYSATLVPSGELTTGDFVITLSSPAVLGSGTYWVSVQANLNYLPDSRQWSWRERTVQSHNPSAWQNPGDGDSTHGHQCISWGKRQGSPPACSVGNYPDLLFKLGGTITVLNYSVYLPLVIRNP